MSLGFDTLLKHFSITGILVFYQNIHISLKLNRNLQTRCLKL